MRVERGRESRREWRGDKADIGVMSLKDPPGADFQALIFTAHSLATNFLFNQCVDK